MSVTAHPFGDPDPHVTSAWLAAIIESSGDAIIGHDLNNVIHSWNQAAEKIFGHTAAEMTGTSILRLIPPDRLDEETRRLAQIRRGDRVDHFETRRLTKAGRLLDVSVTASPIRDRGGRIVGGSMIARDISGAKEREREIARLTRLYAALSQVNEAIVWMPTREELLRKVCQVLVEHGGFQLAWIGWNDPANHELVPVALWGDENDYIKNIKVCTDDRPEGHGPSGTAFREQRTYICNDLLQDPATRPWRAELERRRLRASAVFVIRCQNQVVGTLNVYADEAGFFQDKEVALLTEAATDVSFGLENFLRNDERRQAELKVRTERDFSAAIINSLPGVLYLYDQAGRFLRWNRNFERVTGYTAAEIATLHPLDFFAAADKERLAARIGEVFTRGESSVEAGFVTKAGRILPYFFTGNVVQFEGQTCLVGVGIDISGRVSAEAAQRESEERFNAFMDATPTIAWMTDAEGRHLFMNRAWDEAFGLKRADWIGKTAADLVPPETAERIRDSDRAVLAQDRAIEIPEESGVLRGRPFVWNCIKFPFRNAAGDRFIGGVAIDITARKQAEAARGASEARYRTLFDQAPDGMVIADARSNYLDANPSMCRMLGYTREELIGLNAAHIVVPEEVAHITPALAAIQSQGEYHREWRFRRKDGSLFPAEVIATQMPDGNLLGMIRDITERRQAETALRESEAKLRALFEQAPLGIAVIDSTSGRFLTLNPQYCKIVGYPETEMLTLDFQRITHPADLASDLEHMHRLQTGELKAFQIEKRYYRKDGALVWVNLTCVPLWISASGQPQHIAMVEDITDRKRAEEALHELNASLERKVAGRTAELSAALVRAEAADQIKSAFLATMSHELRTPLNSIIGFTGIVLQGLAGPLNPEQTKQLGMVRGSARHLLELINDVLDISKIEAGQLEVRAEPFDLRASIERVTASVRPLAEKKGLSLQAAITSGVGEMTSDRRRVEQVLLNLLNNALKFTEQGRVSLTADSVADFRTAPDSPPVPAVRFQVTDTGIGMKREDLAKLFQPFRQIDSGLTRLHEGTGLGLVICRRLAGLMGGTIAVASEWGQGSVFTVVLPLHQTASP